MSDSYLAAVGKRTADASEPPPARIWLVSDVHAEYKENLSWLRELGASSEFKEDVLILAGDVSADLGIVRDVFRALLRGFKTIFFTPGNHDCWTKPAPQSPRTTGARQHWSSQPSSRPSSPARQSSLEKLRELFELCAELGVHTQPAHVAGAVIAPILSWYHASWDTEPDVIGWDIPPHDMVMKDFYMCAWPPPLSAANDSVARHLDALNDEGGVEMRGLETRVRALLDAHPAAPLITFSHFVPRMELNPEK